MNRTLSTLILSFVILAGIHFHGSAEVVTPKRYIANLSQSGTDAPVAIVFENTLGGTPVLSRSSPGNYYITLNGAFPDNAVTVFINGNNDGAAHGQIAAGRSYDDAIIISTGDGQDGMDGVLNGVSISITVYSP